MEKSQKRDKKIKWIILVLLLLLVLIVLFASTLITSNKTPPPGPTQGNSTTKIEPTKVDQPEPQKIIKCQTVIVNPKTTTELFTYISGDMMRADYRVSAATEEDSFKTQILYDGEKVYIWKPPNYFGGTRPVNPVGQKMKLSDFKFSVNVSELGNVVRFGAPPLSGDHICSEWDGVDPVYEVPSDFTFETATDINAQISSELVKICKICDNAGTDEIKLACRKNLICDN